MQNGDNKNIEIIGAAAIRSVGFGEKITLTNCNFSNQTTSHLSSCIWFIGRELVIIS